MTEPAIDTGEILEALNDKTDRDCRNVDTTSGADVVIEYQLPTSTNGYRWYRLYKSGWIEQGGILDSIASVNYSATFLKTMNDTNYTSLVTGGYNSTSDRGGNYVNERTTTGMTFNTCNVVGYKISWEVKGFAAQS